VPSLRPTLARGTETLQTGGSTRYLLFAALCIIALLLFWPSLASAFTLGFNNDRYLQVAVAPLLTGFLILWDRKAIFSQVVYSPTLGIPLLTFATLLGLFQRSRSLPLAVIPVVLFALSAFLLCFGVQSLRAALYPLGCLFLTIPYPLVWMDRVAINLQYGSAGVSYSILRVTGLPVFRHGLVFSLPGLDFEVAPECSGIRSSLALLMISLIAAYLYLRSGWSRLALILLTVPIALFKNAARIVVLAILGAYVDRIYIDGPLHHKYGGLVFSVLGAILFVLVLVGLQFLERWLPGRSKGKLQKMDGTNLPVSYPELGRS
jgi:exosortase